MKPVLERPQGYRLIAVGETIPPNYRPLKRNGTWGRMTSRCEGDHQFADSVPKIVQMANPDCHKLVMYSLKGYAPGKEMLCGKRRNHVYMRRQASEWEIDKIHQLYEQFGWSERWVKEKE